MGSSSSKAARGIAARKFPTRSPGTSVPQPVTKPAAYKPNAPPTDAKDEGKSEKSWAMAQLPPKPKLTCLLAIRTDGMDPDFAMDQLPSGDFARRLQQMGVAQPNPTYSASSTATPMQEHQETPTGPLYPSAIHNVTLSALEARRAVQQQADEDFEAMGRASSQGRRFIDMRTLVDAMQLLSQGRSPIEVEKKLQLQPGLLSKLGRADVLTHISSVGVKKDEW